MIKSNLALGDRIKNLFTKNNGKKADTFEGITLVESYDTDPVTIENVEDYYKLVTKISAIYKSLSEISQIINSTKFEIVTEVNNEPVKTIPPIIEMLLKQPHPDYNYQEFISMIIMDLLIAGHVFVYLEQNKKQDSGLSLRRVDPRKVELKNGVWNETYGNFETRILEPDYLIHVKFMPNFNNPKIGMGIIANNVTLFTNIMRQLEYRESFFKNGCMPSGLFSLEGSGVVVTDKIRDEIREKYQGSQKAGEPLVLPGNVKYQQIQLDPITLKISEELILLNKEVMSVFGLPRYLMELGLRDSGQKFNNHAKQQEHYIKSTIVPIADKVEMLFTNLVKRYDAKMAFKFQIDVEIYSEDALQKLLDAGVITPNEHRRLMSIKESEDKNLDKHYINNTKILMSDIAFGGQFPVEPSSPPGKPATPQPAAAPPEKPEKKKIDNAKPREKTWRDDDYLSEPLKEVWTYEELAIRKNKRRIIQDFQNLNKKTRDKKSKEYIKKINDYLTLQYIAFMTAMKKHTTELERLTKPQEKEKAENKDVNRYINKIYDEAEEKEKINSLILPIFISVGAATFANTANILTQKIPFSVNDPGVAKHVNLLREKTVLVAASTRNQIEEVVRRGIENNFTSAEVAKDMWRHFVDEDLELPDKFTVSTVSGRRLRDRAVTISRNEVARANRLFSVESMKQSGVIKSIRLVGVPDADSTCTPYFNQDFPFEMAEELSSIHVNCRCTIVPGEISTED